MSEIDKQIQHPISNPNEDTIDLIALAKTLWNGRRAVIWSVAVFAILGVFVALFSPVEYQARTVLVPQVQSKSSGLGGLSSLAAMAGFNLDAMQGGSAELSPMIYPQIVQSIPFQKEIMHTPFSWEKSDKPANLLFYYDSIYKAGPIGLIKKYTIGLPGLILKTFRGNDEAPRITEDIDGKLVSYTKEEKALSESLKNQLNIEVNSKEGYITITANAPEALAAAEMAEKAQDLLQKMVTEFKIDKAKQNLAFIEDLFSEKKEEFNTAQTNLAKFRDRNLNLGSAVAKTEEERLESEYQLSFSVFSEVAKQLENAKIKVKEDTPIFSIIEPVSIPMERSKPNIKMIVIIWIFLGVIAGIGWVFGKHFFQDFRHKWYNTID